MDQTWAAERENQALSLVMKLEGQPFTYLGPDSFYHGKTSTFSLLNDMNCCGATDRILFATDSPWSGQKESVEYFRKMDLTEAEKTQILGENAKKLLTL